MPSAVITSVHPYGCGLIVGSHQIARELTRRGWQVLLLSDPASIVHLLGAPVRASARARVRAAWRGAVTDAGCIALTPFTLLPLARDFGAGVAFNLRGWPWVSLPWLPRFLARAGLRDVDLFFLDSPLAAALTTALRPRRLVLRVFDDTSEEPPWPPALEAQARALAHRADLVAVTSPALADRARTLGARRIHLMPNGADVEHFARPRAEPADLAPIARPRVVYAGAIAPWVDVALMDAVAQRMPQASFIWIGPGRADTIGKRSNVYRLGPRSYDALPAYLQHCDVGVIPFDRRRYPRLVDSVHPLKLYDYLAAGLRVVATPWRELERIGAPVQYAVSAPEFVARIEAALEQQSPSVTEFLTRASWRARVDGLLTQLAL